MAIRKKEYHFKNSIEVEEYVDGRFGARGNRRTETMEEKHLQQMVGKMLEHTSEHVLIIIQRIRQQ